MPLFAIYSLDKPDSVDLRLATRAVHLEYLKGWSEKVKLGGPLLDDADQMIGSLAIIDAADRAEVESFAANDPYAKAGLFASVEIRGWRWVVNPPG